MIAVGDGQVLLAHEPMARHAAHRLEHAGVADASLAELRVDHLAALPRGFLVALRGRADVARRRAGHTRQGEQQPAANCTRDHLMLHA